MDYFLTHEKIQGFVQVIYEPNPKDGVIEYLGVIVQIKNDDAEVRAKFIKFLMSNLKFSITEETKNDPICTDGKTTLKQESFYRDADDATRAYAGELKREKIAIWCGMYKQIIKEQYKMQGNDWKALDNIGSMEKDLIKIFLNANEWWNKGNKTIANYVSRQNQILEIRNQASKKDTLKKQQQNENYDPKQLLRGGEHYQQD